MALKHWFRIWSRNPVFRERGFYLKWWIGKEGNMEYREGERALLVYAQPWATGPFSVSVNPADILAWSPPHHGEKLSDLERARVLDNIRAALDWYGCGLDLASGIPTNS